MAELSGSQRRSLRAQAHHLHPVVNIGKQGLTDGVVKAVAEALTLHELIKVRFVAGQDEKDELLETILGHTKASVAGRVGHIAILYKAHPDPAKRRIAM